MIRLESVHIEELRGIRRLDIDFARSTYAICGPNGAGKSGVVDAIEFGLTGRIGRLTGRGSKKLTVAEHGPHVDKANTPETAFVRLQVYLTTLRKSVSITRTVASPRRPTVVPSDDDVLQALRDYASHPEFSLSRREILKFILVEPGERSEEIQAILKLDGIGETRSALLGAKKHLRAAWVAAEASVTAARENLSRHLETTSVTAGEVLGATNARRRQLGLPDIEALTANTSLDAGLEAAPTEDVFDRLAAAKDVRQLLDRAGQIAEHEQVAVRAIEEDLVRIDADPDLLATLRRRALVQQGLDLLDGDTCPLCEAPWESRAKLVEHLRSRLAKSRQAEEIQARLLRNAEGVLEAATVLKSLIAAVRRVAATLKWERLTPPLAAWDDDLEALRKSLTSVEGIRRVRARLGSGWHAPPDGIAAALSQMLPTIPPGAEDPPRVRARTFLNTAQIRLDDYRKARRREAAAKEALNGATEAYQAYCDVAGEHLGALYRDIEGDFVAFYRALNAEDEADFQARLIPEEGKVDLSVAFYGRGLFPPAAYHSEGHQDGMGVCLYLALMKRLFQQHFAFALLDDVVQSVDSGHRYKLCQLLKTEFPDTQFVLTTHDRVWAEQMRSAGLITRANMMTFHGWTLESGPVAAIGGDVWSQIDEALDKGRVDVAAPMLRRHLEYASRLLASELRASVAFRADGDYELGELLPNVLTRMKDLLGKAASVAHSWSNHEAHAVATERKKALGESAGAMAVEQWAVNKAVHYNEWANLSKEDFRPVVESYKRFLEFFRCASCGSWLCLTGRPAPDSVRCACTATIFNLKEKEKSK